MTNEEQRTAEIESLSSIFPDLLEEATEKRLIFKFERDIGIAITLPDDYPSTSPPNFELSGPYLCRQQKEILHNSLNDAYVESMGLPVIFNWISIIQDFISDLPQEKPETCDGETSYEATIVNEEEEEDNMNIKHGEVFTDRKSAFQAHASSVNSKEDVDRVMQILKSNSKINRATHNIMAYRYSIENNGKIIQYHDCEDDGEHGASSKMLELMDRMGANNVIVVVTRWYGGIHLGPDRFRHINNLTRQILCDNNFVAKKS